MRYLIIGSGIAGISAAKAIRQQDSTGEIIVYTRDFHPLGLYARKDMARRLAQANYQAEDLLFEGVESLAQAGITLQYHDIIRLFPNQHQILKHHHIRRSYDRILLATGAVPRLIDVPGLHYIGVHQVWNFEDVSLIQAWLPQLRDEGAVIIGGGILGLDMAYALNQRGVPVTLVARDHTLGMPLLPERAGFMMAERARQDGITLIFGETVTAYLSRDERVIDGVQLSSGRVLPTRMALCTIGVSPNVELVEETGIEIDEFTGAVAVNAFMQTSMPDVYAAGTCAVFEGAVARNWRTSAEQGRIAGLNMVGIQTPYQPDYAGDLDTHFYDLPMAYFGEQHGDIWTWTDSNQYVQVVLHDNLIIGALLLGEIAAAAPQLLHYAQTRTPVDIRHLMASLTVSTL